MKNIAALRMLTTTAIVAVLVTAFSATAQAEDWTRLRGPAGSGTSDDAGLPTTWSADENIVWKTAMPGFGSSTPITLGDKIYLTAYSGYGLDRNEPGEQADLRQHVLCIDRATGKILWDKSTKANLPEEDYRGMMALHGYASSSLATDGEALYAFFGRSGVLAYSMTGELLWKAGVGEETHGWGSSNSPILTDNLVIVNASIESESVVALAKKDGKEVWRAEGIERSWSTPALVALANGKQELVVSMENEVRGYDPATGEQLWVCDSVKDYVCPMVVVDKDIVYISGGRRPLTVAIRAGGRGDVTDTHTVWTLRKATKVPSPLIHDGLLYWIDNRGVAVCVDAKTGDVVYEQRLTISGGGDKVYGSISLADGKIYAASRVGGTVVLAEGRDFKLLAKNDLGDESVFNATPVISNGQLLLRSDRFLYCIGN